MITFIIRTPEVLYISYRIRVRFLCCMDVVVHPDLSLHVPCPNVELSSLLFLIGTWCFLGSTSQCILFLLKKKIFHPFPCVYILLTFNILPHMSKFSEEFPDSYIGHDYSLSVIYKISHILKIKSLIYLILISFCDAFFSTLPIRTKSQG